MDIPGEQREAAKYLCEQCGHEGIAQWESEKGIDSSLAVRMFDTADSWDTAYLLSGDADFVPAVASLRRRGKIVIGAGFAEPSSALVRECYYYEDLAAEFVRDDMVAFRVFGRDGLASLWLGEEVEPAESPKDPTADIELTVTAVFMKQGEWTEHSHLLNLANVGIGGSRYLIYFLADGSIDMRTRDEAFFALTSAFPMYFEEPRRSEQRADLSISSLAWNGIERRLPMFAASHPKVRIHRRGNAELTCTVSYSLDLESGRFVLSGVGQ